MARLGLGLGLGASPAADAIGSVLDLPVTGGHVVQALTPGFCDAASVYLLERWVLDAGAHSEAEAPAQIEARRLALRLGSAGDGAAGAPDGGRGARGAVRPGPGGPSGRDDGDGRGGRTGHGGGTGDATGSAESGGGPQGSSREGSGGAHGKQDGGLLPVGEVLVFPRHTPYARALATGRTQVLDAVDRHTSDRLAASGPDDERIRELLRSTSFMVVPLRLQGAAIGFVACTRGPRLPRFGREDVVAAESLAARAAVALDNARRYEHERRTALAIRNSLLPPTGKAFDGCRVAHGYRPAGPDDVIGGDWYDVLPRPGGRVGLIVGDAMGHGPEAAVAMIQLRTAARTLAGLDTDPRDLLRGLDALAADTPGASFATCMYAEWDAERRTCTVVGAGHPPPLLREPGRRSGRVPLTPGLPLGIGSWNGTATVLEIRRPTLLLLYSDGLVEARRTDIDEGIERLARALDDGVAGLPGRGGPDRDPGRGSGPGGGGSGGGGAGTEQPALQSLCDGLLNTAVPGGTADDRTLLLAELLPGGA